MKKFDQKTCKLVRLIFGIILSVYTVVFGIVTASRILDIYFTGAAAGIEKPYTSDLFMGRIKTELAAPFWIWIFLIFAGFVLWEVFYIPEKRKALTDARYVLQRLQKRIPAQVGENLQGSFNFVKQEQKTLKILHRMLCVEAALMVIEVIIYLCVPSNFGYDPATNSYDISKVSISVINMCKFVLPIAAIAYIAGLVYVIYYGYSAKRQLPYVKKLTQGIKAPQAATGKFAALVQSKYFILGVRIAVACFAVAFIIAGCLNKSTDEVLGKAIRICKECIGLG